MTFKPRFKQKPSKKCWCGSGRLLKNCHGDQRQSKPTLQLAPNITKKPQITTMSAGIPGEEHKIVVEPIFDNKPYSPSQEKLAGRAGNYKVQMLLSRPGYATSVEREYAFIDELIGSSYLLICKPVKLRTEKDTAKLSLQVFRDSGNINFDGLPNDAGYLGKLVVDTLYASNAADAERIAYSAIAPFLSAWSLHMDIPIHIEAIQVTDLQTYVRTMGVRTPQFEMTPGTGVIPTLSQDFLKYASVYREAMNSNSSFYKFLCLYKLIESIFARRSDAAKQARELGTDIASYQEDVPDSSNGLKKILADVYPWRPIWNDDLALHQIIPAEAFGKRLGYLKEKHLEPIRNGIAHALLRSGEIRTVADDHTAVQQVNKWLPFCRIWVRLMLRNEFPREFAFTLNPDLASRPQ